MQARRLSQRPRGRQPGADRLCVPGRTDRADAAAAVRRLTDCFELNRLLSVAHRNVLPIILCRPEWEVRRARSAGRPGGNMSEGVSPSPRGTRPGFAINTHNLIGGLIVAVLALLLLGWAFYVPNAVIPRFLSAALVLIGVAAAIGIVPVHAPRDLYGGIALV